MTRVEVDVTHYAGIRFGQVVLSELDLPIGLEAILTDFGFPGELSDQQFAEHLIARLIEHVGEMIYDATLQ